VRIRSSIATVLALALAVAGRASGQGPTRITGRVTDAENKQGIVQVQVIVTGTTVGSVTNDSGYFTLHVPSDAKSLSFRRIGYVPAVQPITGATEYSVVLKRDVLQLERQVVTGVATSVSSKNAATDDPVISGAQLNGAPSPTLENALQGKIAGVQVDQNSGAPGGGLQVQVRGVTSIFGNTQPLYVVDGTIYNNGVNQTGLNAVTGSASNQMNPVGPSDQDQSINRIADINPNDIESIQVLEGAAASSIYGALGAAGVVLITTKKGTQGKPQVDVSQKFGTFNLEHELPVVHYSLSQAYASGTGLGIDSATVLSNYNACAGFCDFQKSLYGGGELSNETDVSVRGGSPSSTYFISGQTKYDNGLQINTGYNKQTVRTSLTEHILNTITATGNVSYTSSMTRTGVNGNDNLGISGYDVIAYTPSWFNMAGHASPANGGGYGGYVNNLTGPANAYQDANYIQTPDEVNHTTIGGTINWKAFTTEHQSLELNLLGGADFTNEHVFFYAPPGLQVEQTTPAFPGVSTANDGYARLSNYSVSIVHHLTLSGVNATTSIGLTRDKNEQYQTANTAQNCTPGLQSFWNGCTVQSQFVNHTQVNDQGYYGQEQLLLFNETLALTGGVNAERSTSNGGVNRYYPYPKVSGSYRFVNLVPGLDELKIRGAYGQAGTLPIYGAKYNSLCSTNYTGLPATNYCPSGPLNFVLGNPDIKPETNTTIETGFDATLFHSRAQFSATVFRKRITDMLLPDALPASTGATDEWLNGGQLSNYGLELTLNATPIQKGLFTWVTTENYSRIYNRVDELPVPSFVAGPAFGGPFGEFQIAQGNPITALWGVKTIGGPLVPLGNSLPAFTLGFGQDLSYGPLHAHIFFDWREGQSVSNLTQNYFDADGNSPDVAAATARLVAEGNGLTPYVEKASFLKLRELSLKYDLPASFVEKAGHGYVRYASLSLTGRNLLTWTNYPGLDPEVSNFGIQSFARAQDVTPYPPSRSYFISIDLGF
jgi:TonB-dependent starch-binding outer membrane protein SusC